MCGLASRPPIPSKETGDRTARPTRFLLGLGGTQTLVLNSEASQYVTTCADLIWVAPDGNDVEAGSPAAAAVLVVLPAVELAVKPDDTSRNRILAEGTAAQGGKGRNNPVGHKAGPEIVSEFGLGAGPRSRRCGRGGGGSASTTGVTGSTSG